MDNKLKPALIGGGLLGVLSGIPIVNFANCACCAWVIVGGVVASYLYQSKQPPGMPPNYGDGFLLGALTGLIGAVVSVIVSTPFSLIFNAGSISPEQIEGMMGGEELPPAVENMLATMGSGGFSCAGILFGLMFAVIVYPIFAGIGSLIGTALFTKK